MARSSPPAHRRLRAARLRARRLLRSTAEYQPNGEDIKTFMKMDVSEYGATKTVALPLGLRTGLPERAACVDTAAVLTGFNDKLAEQCLEPMALLKEPEEWPDKPVKPFALLDGTYNQLVSKGEQSGLLETREPQDMLHLGGELAAGASR